MNQQKDNFVLEEEKKDKEGKFIYQNLPQKEKIIVKDEPGINQAKLDGEVQVLNNGSGGGTSNSGLEVVSSATVPYDVVVTGVGFKPTTVIINANPAVSGHAVASWGSVTDGSTGHCIFQHDNSNTIFSGNSYSNKILNLEWQDSSGNYPDIEAELKSMDDDGFTLTVTRNDEANSFNFNYTCF